MKNLTTILLAVSTLAALNACGDNQKKPDAQVFDDAPADAPWPAAPALGAAIDRMGRPAVNTALNAVVNDNPLKTTKKDNYNHAVTNQDAWSTVQLDPAVATNTIKNEFSTYVGVLDVLDKGTAIPGAGCGNAALYNGAGVGAPAAYGGLAGVLADDELYVDTAIGSCNFYLSLEVEVATSKGVLHTQCGGRTLQHDVVDVSYSLLAAGVSGFDAANGFAPRVGDAASMHTDYSAAFPYLGAPH